MQLLRVPSVTSSCIYLRNTASQARLNHVMILHYTCDKLDVANEYIKRELSQEKNICHLSSLIEYVYIY